MVGKNYHVEKNKHLFFAHYLICLIMFFDVFNDYFLGRISIFLGRISIFLGRISKWGRGGGYFGISGKIYTPVRCRRYHSNIDNCRSIVVDHFPCKSTSR